jgi:hypothetical protein
MPPTAAKLIYGLCFDGSRILGRGVDGQPLDFCNTLENDHYTRAAEDYALARSLGITRFRDSVLWAKTSPSQRRLNTAWLDQLADLSEGQTELAMLHYLGLPWISEAEFWDGRAAVHLYYQARYIAARYKGCFRSYNACVELGTWTNLIAAPHNRQWPFGNKPWWDVYKVTSKIAINIAKGLKHGDPDCKVSLCEPWGMGHMSYDDMARPFDTLLGLPDEVAEREGCHTWQEGEPGLLDIIGLNCYVPAPMGPPLAEAQHRYPDKEVIIGETANTQTGHDPALWDPATWWARFEELGQPGLQVNWCPGLEMRAHDYGEWMGACLINRQREPCWQAPHLSNLALAAG